MKSTAKAWRTGLIGLAFLPLLLFFQNFSRLSQPGSLTYWNLHGVDFTASGSFPHASAVDLKTWQLVDSKDVNQDGHLDLIWQNKIDGSIAIWYMDGVNFLSEGTFPKAGPYMGLREWRFVGMADLNQDGNLDIIWQNRRNGSVVFWYMKGVELLSAAPLPAASAEAGLLPWTLVGAYDFDGGGKPALLWQNRVSGRVGTWSMDGVNVKSVQDLKGAPPGFNFLNWELRLATDLNGDGKPDLVWQNPSDGTASYWLLSGLEFRSTGIFSDGETSSGPNSRQLVSVSDLKGDGHSNLVFQLR